MPWQHPKEMQIYLDHLMLVVIVLSILACVLFIHERLKK